jgi:TatD DNase family protein
MIFTDTHTHLYAEEFEADRDQVVRRAVERGVKFLFLPGIDRSYYPRMMDLCSKYPDHCFPMIGLHPTSVKANWQEELDFITETLNRGDSKFYAIGEVGMDLYWDRTFAEEQEKALEVQANLAIQYHLPMVIHTRNSFGEVVAVLEKCKSKGLSGVFHCFGGSIEQANQAVALGFFLGIGGILTYKNSGLQKVVEQIGIEHLVLETDSPWLTPVPHRGQRNESSYIPLIAEKIAEITGMAVDEIAQITTENAMKLFKVQIPD